MPFQATHPKPSESFEATDCSAEVRSLLDRWDRTEASVVLAADRWNVRSGPSAKSETELAAVPKSFLDIEKEQTAVIETLAAMPAQSAADALAKLQLWVSIVCPDASAIRQLTPVERLVLSAFEDLVRLDG